MKVVEEKEVKVILTLTLEEVIWLKGIVQNSLVYPNEEDSNGTKMRRIFWEALGDVGEHERNSCT